MCNDFVRWLCTCSLLTDVRLDGCNRLTVTGMEFFGNLQNLETLDIAYCEGLRDTKCEFLHKCKSLVLLRLDGLGELGAGALRVISGLPRLSSLAMRSCGRVSGEDLLRLGEVRSLKRLELNGCDVSNDAVQSLRHNRPDIVIYGP